MQNYSKRVYSTARSAVTCSRCGQEPCCCKPDHPLPSQSQTAAICLDRKGRKGKSVTLIKGLTLNAGQLAELCKTLKAALATGGTVKEGHLELQGDHRAKIAELLSAKGYKIKLVGG